MMMMIAFKNNKKCFEKQNENTFCKMILKYFFVSETKRFKFISGLLNNNQIFVDLEQKENKNVVDKY